MVFFSYRTKRELPAGDQFWKFSRQCSIFGRIGDQWVSSKLVLMAVKNKAEMPSQNVYQFVHRQETVVGSILCALFSSTKTNAA